MAGKGNKSSSAAKVATSADVRRKIGQGGQSERKKSSVCSNSFSLIGVVGVLFVSIILTHVLSSSSPSPSSLPISSPLGQHSTDSLRNEQVIDEKMNDKPKCYRNGLYSFRITPVRKRMAPAEEYWDARSLFTRFRTPIIFYETPAQHWGAMKKWNMDYFIQNVPDGMLKQVYFRKNRENGVFGPIWRPETPLGRDAAWIQEHGANEHFNPEELLDISVHEFYQNATNERHKPVPHDWLYFVNDIEDLGQTFVEDVLPMDGFISTPKSAQINLWTGQHGVTTHMHWDSYNNFVVQVVGQKRFLLFPPSVIPKLHPFPFMHPSYGQLSAQVDYDFPDNEVRCPPADSPEAKEFEDLAGFEAVLNPGDVLLLPPCWAHQVSAVSEFPFSVNAWSVTDEGSSVERALSDVEKALGEFTGKWTANLRRLAGSFLLEEVIRSVVSGLETFKHLSPYEIVQQLVASRFQPLMDRGTLPTGGTLRCGDPSAVADRKDLDQLAKLLRKTSTQVSRIFGTIPDDTRMLWLQNFLEAVALWSVDARAPFVGAFLSSCIPK